MLKIIGFVPIEGVVRQTNQPFRFYEVSCLPLEKEDKVIGTRAKVFQLNDDELANELAYKLSQALKDGSDCLTVDRVISHYYSYG